MRALDIDRIGQQTGCLAKAVYRDSKIFSPHSSYSTDIDHVVVLRSNEFISPESQRDIARSILRPHKAGFRAFIVA
jgi:hypothetical protein